MTDHEKIEMLAKWMGWLVEPVEWNWNNTLLRINDGRYDDWWNPLRNRDDAMDLYEQLVELDLQPTLTSARVDGAPMHILDITNAGGPTASTIAAAISEAVIERLSEHNGRLR